EPRDQALQTEPCQRIRARAFIELNGAGGVGEHLTQRARRKIGRARHAVELLCARSDDASRAPAPQPRKCAKEQRFAGTRLADDEQPFSGPYLDVFTLELDA